MHVVLGRDRGVLRQLLSRGAAKAMPAYRLYRLDRAGKIESAGWIAADDDAQAMQLARETGGACELWDRGRLVGRFEQGQPRSP